MLKDKYELQRLSEMRKAEQQKDKYEKQYVLERYHGIDTELSNE